MKSNNPKIEWKEIGAVKCLFFTFDGIFRKSDAQIAVEQWRSEMTQVATKKVTVVWQCLEMKNYEREARQLWQEALKEFESQIGMIWLVTDSVLIQAGAEIMSFFTYFEMKVVTSLTELEKKLKKQLA